MITAKIIADSVNPRGDRIVTWELTYPRFIHAEFMTHRVFSRNAASSRAIPIEKMIEAVRARPAEFEQYGAANRGMQAQELAPNGQVVLFERDWKILAEHACEFAGGWSKFFAKQIVNRALEPWMHMTVIATATEHDNFFALRAHPDAQPEFQVLAYRMLALYLKSRPLLRPVLAGRYEGAENWHLPYVTDEERSEHDLGVLLKVCTARCARVSYTRHGEGSTFENDIALHDRLAESGHWSPFEHAASPTSQWGMSGSNFRGWMQYRKLFAKENRTPANLTAIMEGKPEWITCGEDEAPGAV